MSDRRPIGRILRWRSCRQFQDGDTHVASQRRPAQVVGLWSSANCCAREVDVVMLAGHVSRA